MAENSEIKVSTPRRPMHCRDCGNCDCPKVSADPYWDTCPAMSRPGGDYDKDELLRRCKALLLDREWDAESRRWQGRHACVYCAEDQPNHKPDCKWASLIRDLP